MNLFADSLVDLRYEHGLVSFRLTASTGGGEGVHIHMPMADAQQVTRLLAAEMPKIAAVHGNWLAVQHDKATLAPEAVAAPTAPSLGRKLASA